MAAIVSGIAVGGTYALVAVGITQIFAVTRVLNFAQAGFTIWGAYIYALLTYEHHWAVGLAAVATVLIIGVMGLLAEILVFRYAHKATTVNKIIMTFGMLSFLSALATKIWSREVKVAVPLFPRGGFSVLDTAVSWQQFANLMAVVVVVLAMTLFLRRTRLGLQTRAMAEDITVAELMGTSRSRIGMLNWGLAAMVGGLGGVLAASLQPFQANQFVAYFLFALIATLLGGLRSLAWTAVGGVALGVIQSVSQIASNKIGVGTLAIFVGVVTLVLLRKHWPSELSKIGWTKPQLSVGHKYWWLNRTLLIVGWGWLMLAAHGSDFWGQTGAVIMVYTVAALSLVPLIGWTGQISLAQGGFMAIGAGVFAIVYDQHRIHMVLSILLVLVAGVIAGALVGTICFRLSFVQTAIVTLAFTGVVVGWLLYTPWLHTQGGRISIVGPSYLNTGRSAFVGFGIIALLVGLMLRNIRHSQWGIAFISVRTAPDMARHFGLHPSFVRIAAFSLSGAIAALAGCLYMLLLTISDASAFGVGLSLQVLIFAVAGGTGSIYGPFIGAFVFLAIPQALNLGQYGATAWPDLLGGIGIMQLMASRPDGLSSLMRRPARPIHRTPKSTGKSFSMMRPRRRGEFVSAGSVSEPSP